LNGCWEESDGTFQKLEDDSIAEAAPPPVITPTVIAPPPVEEKEGEAASGTIITYQCDANEWKARGKSNNLFRKIFSEMCMKLWFVQG
jgi:hypothetical protein